MSDKQKMQPCTEIVNYGDFGASVLVPKRSCMLCKNLTDLVYDSNGPYLFVCYKAIGEDGIMDVARMGGPYGNCDAFKPKE